MSLFVGNVSKHVSHRELQTLFKKYGKCKIDLRDRYAFVQFDVDNHAEAAKKQLQHQTFHGLQLNIQWSKNSGRFGQNNKRKDGGAGGNSANNGQRKRSRSRQNRQNRWRRDDRWGRRSPSNQRSSPSYSGNKDIETFVSVCPRDQIILKKLLSKKVKQQQKGHRDSHRRDNDAPKVNSSTAIVNENEQQNNQVQVQNRQQESKKIIEQEEGVIHEDGQIQTHQ